MTSTQPLSRSLPPIAVQSYFSKTEKDRLFREFQSCQILVNQLKEGLNQPRNYRLQSKIVVLQKHIDRIKDSLQVDDKLLNSPVFSLDPEEIQSTDDKIAKIRKLLLNPFPKNSEAAQLIRSLPKEIQEYLGKTVSSLSPIHDGANSAYRRLLRKPNLLCTLRDHKKHTLLDKIRHILSLQMPMTHAINPRLDHYFGAHLGAKGTTFRVFAPHATSVSVRMKVEKGRFSTKVLKNLPHTGVWEIYAAGIKKGCVYEYIIEGADGKTRYKTDPFGVEAVEYRGVTFRHQSVVCDRKKFQWQDRNWMQKRKEQPTRPMNILEIHPYVWKKPKDGKRLNYSSLADEMIAYCKKQNYTHVELMGLLNYPSENSMGYQVTNYFAPNFRFGTLDEFKKFISKLHKANIGVFIDFSSAHFPRDEFALPKFDGTPLFEKIYPMYSDPKKSLHPYWGNHEFKYESSWVQDFVASSVRYWCEELHIDGVRFDAVSNTIAKDYARKKGQYLPNLNGKAYDQDAAQFFSKMNSRIHEIVPGVLLMAENSSYAPTLKTPADRGGLDFDLDWGFYRQADIFHLMRTPFNKRSANLHLIKNAVTVNASSSLTVSSHDEFAHGKKSLLGKMPGTRQQKIAGCKLYHSLLYCSPGRGVLSCMGTEFGQPHEWTRGLLHPQLGIPSVQWDALEDVNHRGVHRLTRDLGALYLKEPALHSSRPVTFFDDSDRKNCVVRYIRRDPKGKKFLIVHNFSPSRLKNYAIPVPKLSFTSAKEIFNTDHVRYAGSGLSNPKVAIRKKKASPIAEVLVHLPALSTLIIELS